MSASAPQNPDRPLGANPDHASWWGPLLIALGVFFLVSQWAPFNLSNLVIGGLMCVGGAFFIVAYRRDPATWPLLIPAVALLALGIGRIVSSVAPRLGNDLGGGLLMASIGIAFLFAYRSDRADRWWAVIPAGALLGIAAGNFIHGIGGSDGGWLFVGLGIAFLYLAMRAGRPWAVWPGGILLFIGLRDMPGFLGFGLPGLGPARLAVWPLALIALGIWLLVGRRSNQE